MKKNDVICWWSGGVTSAVACKLSIDLFGLDRCRIVMMDTKNEHEDTYRFKSDCEKWYGKEIDVITGVDGDKYKSIEDVWRRFKSLNVASGAICSSELKREVRQRWESTVDYDYQVFGFEFDKKEFNRAKSLKLNYSKAKAIYPLLMFGYDKEDCIRIVNEAGIEVPASYRYGFRNNNCFNTGCVQGGIGYWKKMQRDFPEKFEKMAMMEHELTEMKGEPVTMLKDQSKEAKSSGNILVFLKKHPLYPNLKCIDDMSAREVEPLFECNGFCGTNDLNPRSKTEEEINFEINF
jgi:3'-phosphoadenosine 5'-phosphosulfate sulfotransferase (PAPS reductase)/FAD synthetase